MSRLVRRDENDIQIRSIINLLAAEFAQADDHEGRVFEPILPHYDFQRILQASICQRGELAEVLLGLSEAQNIAKPNAHEFSLMITAQPSVLVGIGFSMP